ncbi:MAG: aminotransferase class I/II-fold pyridoxal phosphate-dependent enzyme [Candidatus Micrarchaeota archaeon]|nr:aminotransferase class I/II-fold pyridoxal phosphate-dependent enzyme [Candidatus Micrarchaeota archaeon]
MGFLSERSRFAINPLEEDDAIAEALERKGKEIIKLNRGDPAVYFPTPQYIKEAYIEAIRESKTHYTETRGAKELVDAVMGRYRRLYGLDLNEDDVVVTAGVSEALYMLNSALIDRNDRAIVFKPYYTQYIPYIGLAGGREYLLDYKENEGWCIDIDELDRHVRRLKHKARVKYVLLTNPNNPTGTVLSRKTLEGIVDLANEHKLLLISDEIYDEIVYNGARFTSIAQVAKGVPYVILNGASKNFDATGFRIGFAVVPGRDALSKGLKAKLADFASVRVSANAPAQYALAEGMNNVVEHNRAIRYMVGEIEDRVNFAVKLLNENTSLSTVRPRGAYYIFPKIDLKGLHFKSDKEFVDSLLKSRYVQITRGSGFGTPGHIRIVSLPPKETLGEAITKLNEFCRRKR